MLDVSPSDAETGLRIVVVGDGLAGWLAAIGLHGKGGRGGSTSLLAASNIPRIGVGESSTGLLAGFLEAHDVPAGEFAAAARATFKLGIGFSGWAGKAHDVVSAIDNPDVMAGLPLHPGSSINQRAALADGCRVVDAHLHAWLIRAGRVPALAENGRPVMLGTHAWHFDAAEAAAYAERVALARGVEPITGAVVVVDRRPDGSIAALRLEDGRAIEADLFIDCSGQRRLLMDKERPDWVTQTGVIPVNRAVAGFMPLGATIAPVTRAVAASAGWIWEIPTQDRIGVGYVHDAGVIEPEEAWRALAEHAHGRLQRGPLIDFAPGYRRQPWQANGVAIGLASGFCEPLESTSLHLALVQIGWVAAALARPPASGNWREQADGYNAWMARYQDDLADFVALHYSANAARNDFWREAAVRARATDLYHLWSEGPAFPPDEDLCGRSKGLSPNLILPIADGLGLLRAPAGDRAVSRAQRVAAARMRALHREYCAQALPHAEALKLLAPKSQDSQRLQIAERDYEPV